MHEISLYSSPLGRVSTGMVSLGVMQFDRRAMYVRRSSSGIPVSPEISLSTQAYTYTRVVNSHKIVSQDLC